MIFEDFFLCFPCYFFIFILTVYMFALILLKHTQLTKEEASHLILAFIIFWVISYPIIYFYILTG